jgi:hypothetical protein
MSGTQTLYVGKKRAIGSRLIKASKLIQIGEFFFNLAHL